MSENIVLEIKNLSFGYVKGRTILDNLNLKVVRGSFTSILGESGCGKTTLLRLISGFLEAGEGQIFIDGIEQSRVEPEKRKVGIVFQDYALFPHMTVRKNISYGLKIKGRKEKVSKKEFEDKVLKVCENLSLTGLLDRYPHELSGGQQQRVALARSLVLEPEILLMDEPLSNLDSRLRESVRDELAEIQRKLKITTIYVTHDQEEALSLSDFVAVLKGGKLLQYASPREIYFKPLDPYTADFVGKANFITDEGVSYLVRPEWFSLNRENRKGDAEGIIRRTSFLGDRTRFVIETENNKVITADLPTLESNSFGEGFKISLNVTHRWKMQ